MVLSLVRGKCLLFIYFTCLKSTDGLKQTCLSLKSTIYEVETALLGRLNLDFR